MCLTSKYDCNNKLLLAEIVNSILYTLEKLSKLFERLLNDYNNRICKFRKINAMKKIRLSTLHADT